MTIFFATSVRGKRLAPFRGAFRHLDEHPPTSTRPTLAAHSTQTRETRQAELARLHGEHSSRAVLTVAVAAVLLRAPTTNHGSQRRLAVVLSFASHELHVPCSAVSTTDHSASAVPAMECT